MNVEIKTRDEAKADIVDLASDALKLEAMKFILRLRRNPWLGRELETLPATGDLSDCRKIFFDEARHRIIYRLLPDAKNPTVVDVIAVGPRESLDVYVEAVKRLGR